MANMRNTVKKCLLNYFDVQMVTNVPSVCCLVPAN